MNERTFESLLKKVEKPGRYIGNEINSIRKNAEDVRVRFGFAFPDTYEIGMSYLGMQILYQRLNCEEGIACERVFSPAMDMEALLRDNGIPLFTLETRTPVKELDMLGVTLQYELSFTNILNLISLSQIPFLAKERGEEMPLLVGGGPCASNPEPLADFFDVFILGDGEEALPALCREFDRWKQAGDSRMDFLQSICGMSGIYVPSFYDPVYNGEGAIREIRRLHENAPETITKAFQFDLNTTFSPEKNIVPLIETVHDRAVTETFRGCSRGCRFCQAGMIYRPVRERTKENIIQNARAQLAATGHEELSLLSLSTSDHSEFEPMVTELMQMCREENISLSLPSLRLDSFSFKVLSEIGGYKRSGLTFAPEAGSQRLRNVINKHITEEHIFGAITQALELGWNSIKLYFMIGLPTETDEDLAAIAAIARRIMDIDWEMRNRKNGRLRLTVSVSNFVPKAHTPFAWSPQDSAEEFRRKHNFLRERLRIKGVSFHYHESNTSLLEAVFARGDRRLSKLLLHAYALGCKFDSWSEHFRYDLWEQALNETGISADFYATRARDPEEIFPWDHIDCGVTKAFLLKEWESAQREATTSDCRANCHGCGLARFADCGGGVK